MRAFEQLQGRWPTIDFVVHAVAYSDKNELTGRFLNTSRANFKNSMDISAYSFIEVARRAYPMMQENGGTLLTLTYQGSNRVVPNYNVMGVAKAALESATRYLANDLGPDGIRVNAISPGPMKTLAGAAYWWRAQDLQAHRSERATALQRKRSKRSAARRFTWPRMQAPAPPERSSASMVVFTCWACRSPTISKSLTEK